MPSFAHASYADFSETDFITDPFFQQWVIAPEEDKQKFWDEFIQTYPEKKEDIVKAYAFLQQFSPEAQWPDENIIQQSFEKHLSDINSIGHAKVVSIRRRNSYLIIAAAASMIAVVLSVTFLFRNANTNRLITIATRYGEIKKILLPDSSTIILNANSHISFNSNWNDDQLREVWLGGEAFFEVKHLNKNIQNIQPSERFLVHAKDMTIEVLGTAFDVRQRRGTTEVVLQSGSIKLNLKDSAKSSIVLSEGNMFTYNSVDRRINETTTIPESYTAWKEKKLMLNDPTLAQIINYLEDNFGKKIVVEDTALKNRKIEGPISLNNLDDALFIISTVLNTDLEKTDSALIIRARKTAIY
jgi:ferric-dicitrate binding protein FerR (iron transport regulator)